MYNGCPLLAWVFVGNFTKVHFAKNLAPSDHGGDI
jgi:hypothetical protein